MYLRIFWAARKNSRTVRKQSIAAPTSSLPFSSTSGRLARDLNRGRSASVADDFGSVFDDEESRFRSRRLQSFDDDYKELDHRYNNNAAAANNIMDDEAGITLCLSPKRRRPTTLTQNDDLDNDDAANDFQLQPGDAPKVVDVIVSPPTSPKEKPSTGSILRRPLSPPIPAFIRGYRPKPPKLSALRARGGAIFSRPVAMNSVDSNASGNSANTFTSGGPGSRLRNVRIANHIARQDDHQKIMPSLSRQGSQGNDSVSSGNGGGSGTPKRKCSFSSFSECRLLDGERHQTFLFSIEAPSPPETPPCFDEPDEVETNNAESAVTNKLEDLSHHFTHPHLSTNGTVDSLVVPTEQDIITAQQRRRRFSQASLGGSGNNGAGGQDDANDGGKNSSSLTSKTSSEPFSSLSSDNRRGSLNTVVVGAPLSKSASLLSMTSQASTFECIQGRYCSLCPSHNCEAARLLWVVRRYYSAD